MSLIHPTALVDPQARLDASASVGPYAIIGPQVTIGARTRVGAHCVIEGHTTIGDDCTIFQFASLGGIPQDKKYAGEPTRLVIGRRNTIREFCTFNLGTAQDRGETTIGDDNWIMAYVHIAHDCVVGHQTILANNATLAGHVQVGDWAIVGGLTGVHQFTHIGAHAMAGFGSHIAQDVPPFMMVDGHPLAVRGLNVEGLRRRGFSPERIARLKQAYRVLYREGLTLQAAITQIDEIAESHPDSEEDLTLLTSFLRGAQRGIVR